MTENRTNMALVNETLTKDEVMSLLNETLGNRKADLNNYLTIYKGEYTAWDGEVHIGYIVCHNTKTYLNPKVDMTRYGEHHDYYFMEVTLEEVDNPMGTSHLWEPTFHKLMPVTANCLPKSVLPEVGGAKELTQYIVDSCCKDKWEYIEVPMTEEEIKEAKRRDWYWCRIHTTKIVELTYNDIYCYWETPLTEEEQKQRVKAIKDAEDAIIARFSTGELPPAEDDAWYSILANVDSRGFGDYTLENKVIKILKNRGFSVRIDGERDSFGWVTRGIFVDGEMMCLE